MGRQHFADGRAEAGFSMLEILIVLVTTAIVIGLAQPSLNSLVQRNQVRRALDRLAGDVAFARMHAVQEGRRTAIHIDGDGIYTIDTMSTGGTWGTVRTVDLRSEVPGLTLSQGDQRFEFDSRGILIDMGESAVVAMKRGVYGDSMFISPAGRTYRDF